MNTNQITVNGITYNVEATITREDCRTQHPNTYEIMLGSKQIAMHNCRRPNGRKITVVIEFERNPYDGSRIFRAI